MVQIMKNRPILIPEPKSIAFRGGKDLRLGELDIRFKSRKDARVERAAKAFSDEIADSCLREKYMFGRTRLEISVDRKFGEEGYRIDVGEAGIAICSGGPAGAFHAVQTLRQMAMSKGLKMPFCNIEDSPDYPVRGFYHDVTRGKVPKLETLKALADKMAFYKLNQLQLYIEHTFAYMNHPDIWQGSDPLTHQDIMDLDGYCAERFIELVPSFSTFGHFYTAICSPRKSHLNELELDASERAFSFWDRMAHYTLDCSNPESLRLVEEIILETAPLFRSKFYNICCDETFDLGKGKNAEKAKKLGKSRLYVDFLKKIMNVVRKTGKTPMFWGEIVLESPEMLREIPRDSIALNWDYSPECKRDSKPFAESGLKFYVCSGVHGWNAWMNNIESASRNIVNFARKGLDAGAAGLLNTDWGDYGHINSLSSSYHGMILGAAASWNIESCSDMGRFDEDVSRLEFGDASGRLAGVLREISKTVMVSWGPFVWWTSPSEDMKDWERDATTGFFAAELRRTKPEDTGRAIGRLRELSCELLGIFDKSKPLDKLAKLELLAGAKGCMLVHEAHLCLQTISKKKGKLNRSDRGFIARTADDMRRFEQTYSQIWHIRNRPSEYFRIKEILCKTATRLDKLS